MYPLSIYRKKEKFKRWLPLPLYNSSIIHSSVHCNPGEEEEEEEHLGDRLYKARQARAAKARQETLKQSETLQEEIEKISVRKETSSSSSKGNKTKSKKQQVSFALDEHLTRGIFLFFCYSFHKIQFTCSKISE